MKDTKRSGWRKMPGTYAVRLPRGLMTPLFLKTALRVKWVSLQRNCCFSVLLILMDIGAHQEGTKWNSLVQYSSERSNRLWKTTRSVESSLWNFVVMLQHRGDLQSRILLHALTIVGWDQRQKEFRSLFQTQTIGDISWMSIRRNRQAGHRMTPEKMFEGLVWGRFRQCH